MSEEQFPLFPEQLLLAIVQRHGHVPERKPLDLSEMKMTELDQALDAGYADMKAERVRSAKSVFSDIRKDYEL